MHMYMTHTCTHTYIYIYWHGLRILSPPPRPGGKNETPGALPASDMGYKCICSLNTCGNDRCVQSLRRILSRHHKTAWVAAHRLPLVSREPVHKHHGTRDPARRLRWLSDTMRPPSPPRLSVYGAGSQCPGWRMLSIYLVGPGLHRGRFYNYSSTSMAWRRRASWAKASPGSGVGGLKHRCNAPDWAYMSTCLPSFN